MIAEQVGTYEIPEMAKSVVGKALAIVDGCYGTGFPRFSGGLNGGNTFHNGYHSRAVISDFEKLAQVIDLTEIEQAVGVAACSTHDIEHNLIGIGINEEASADWLERHLTAEIGLDEQYATMGRFAVLGTIPIFKDGILVSQSVNELTFKTKRDELVAKMLASADLGRLFTMDGPLLGHLLLKEINNSAPNETMDFGRVIGFQQKQIPLMEQYRYPLTEANTLLGANRGVVAKYAELILKMVEDGAISSWDELVNMDLAFMKSC